MQAKQLTAIAAIAIASALPPSANAHAKLEASSPKAGAITTPAPKEVRLQFNEPLELAFSKIQLVDAKGVAIGPLKQVRDKSSPKAMAAALPPLPAGEYHVHWTTLTHDGHKVKGESSFQVK
jgi:methionine-rich copper-binding protein CopC